MVQILYVLVIGLFSASLALGAPASLTYQGRILKSDNTPLEYNNVSFIFQITSTNGLCVVYEEQLNGINMVNSGGVFDAPIGLGTRAFPTSGIFSVLDALNNSSTLSCKGGATYTPAADDGRKLRVQFHDGSGWKVITPDNIIRSVPYAGFASSAMTLGTNTAADFVLKTGIPTCPAGNVLTSSTAGVLVCVPDTGGAAGVVNSIAGTSPIVATDNGSGAYTISASVGTTAGTLAAGNDSRFTNSRAPSGPATGDLTGNYPAPTIATDAVTTTKILNAAVTTAKIADGNITAIKLAAGTASGQVPRFDGTNWAFAKLNFGDLVNAAGNSPWPSGSCALNQFITWVSVTDGFSCASLNSSMVTTALGFTPVTDARTISTGTATTTGLTGGGALSSNLNLAVNVGTGANQIPQLDSSGKLLATILPTTITDGAWTAASGNVYRNSGNVGIGTTNPTSKLEVQGTASISDISTSQVFIAQAGAGVYPGTVINAYTDTGQPQLVFNRFRGTAIPGTAVSDGDINAVVSGSAFNGTQTEMTAAIRYLVDGTNVSGSGNHPGGKIEFQTRVTNTGQYGLSTAMTIRNSGNVGIGTTSPTTKLEVAGTIKATAFDGPLTATTASTGAGTNTAPSMTFSGDTNTGFYNLSSNDTISVANGGVKTFDFTSLGLISPTSGGANIATAAGTAALPTYSFSGDADTGWWHPAADTLAASTGGTERVRIDSTGNFGVGTTNPNAPLHVRTGSDRNLQVYNSSSITGAVAMNAANDANSVMVPLEFGASKFVFTQGSVGIGTTAPDTSLVVRSAQPSSATHPNRAGMIVEGQGTDVGGRYAARAYSDVEAPALIGYRARGNFAGPTAAQAGDTLLSITGVARDSTGWSSSGSSSATINLVAAENQTAAAKGGMITFLTVPNGATTHSERMRIDQNGSVGIGTANPPSLFANTAANTTDTDTVGVNLAYGQTWEVPSTGLNGYVSTLRNSTNHATGNGLFISSVNTASTSKALQIETGGFSRLTVLGNGNVGIGTKSPGAQLEVVGTGARAIKVNGTTDAFLRLRADSNSTGSRVWDIRTDVINSNFYIGRTTDNEATTDASIFTIAPTNNVGIGTATPKEKFTIGNGHFFHTGGVLSHTFNSYYDQSISNNRYAGYGGTGYAGSIAFVPSTGQMHFATSGTSGAADVATSNYLNRMTINAAGNVGIGNENPTYTLDVNGSARATGSVTAWSDMRAKRNIATIPDALNKILQVRGVTFDWRHDEFPQQKFKQGRDMGVIAQEIEKVFPETVQTAPDGFKSVAYPELVAPLIEAVKELYHKYLAQDEEIKELKAKLNDQDAQLKKQAEELDAIKKKLGL